MIKKDTFILLLGTAVSIGIITILSFFIIWIGFPAENPKESFKDALNFSGGLFSGCTTFGAAIIAAHLFNDWRDQHNKTVDKEIIFGVISRLNNYLYEAEIFHTNIGIFIQSIVNNNYNFTPDDMLKYKETLRNIIVDFENSKRHTITNYSDLEAVMGEKKYTEFQDQCKCICDAADIYTSNLDEFLNQLITKQYSITELKNNISTRSQLYEYIIISDGGLIDRIKAIKKELSAFYRAN